MLLFFAVLAFTGHSMAQSLTPMQGLPHVLTPAEALDMPAYLQSRAVESAGMNMITTPPASPVRTIAEWEELQGLTISWTSYNSMLREIVRNAKDQARVYILTSNPSSTITYLASGGVDTVNVTCLQIPFNSVWCRDYGLWSAYTNDVDSLISVDWIYNRPRPADDASPVQLSAAIGVPVYQTTTAPWDLIHTGGNFMTDGFGTGFSSNLIIDENPNKTVTQIDTIMNRFMGINRYIKMNTLPYDQIHHIDMHMKLLDEETILMGQYPAGVADGPQIEANLLYVLNNFNSVYGTPYKVVRIPMPADNGQYPGSGGRYFTYTNSSFINKTIIVPTYNVPSDTTALRIYREAMPGYNVVGINSLSSIGSLGALHCIDKEMATPDPLLISHQPLNDTYDTLNAYAVEALIRHRSGINNAILWWRTDTLQPYLPVNMLQSAINPDYWIGSIPAAPVGTHVMYYVEANAVSGKNQVRPMPAPDGHWSFDVLGSSVGTGLDPLLFSANSLFPNPSKGITCLEFTDQIGQQPLNVKLMDVEGRTIIQVFNGLSRFGENRLFFDTTNLTSGLYLIQIHSPSANYTQKLLVR
ncbi:MAG: agmatine deiminase family protein [Bacteroidia bacterium]